MIRYIVFHSALFRLKAMAARARVMDRACEMTSSGYHDACYRCITHTVISRTD